MSAGDGAERGELRQVVREFLSERSPSREVRRLMEAGQSRDDEVWAALAGQLGLTGIAVPERYGGAGYGPVELGIVLEEMGGALLVAPYFASVAHTSSSRLFPASIRRRTSRLGDLSLRNSRTIWRNSSCSALSPTLIARPSSWSLTAG